MLEMVRVTLCVPNIETSRHLSPALDLHSPGKVLGPRGFGTDTAASANSQPGYLSEKPGARKSQQMDSEPRVALESLVLLYERTGSIGH